MDPVSDKYRKLAREHLDQSKQLAGQNLPRYACLELRLSIEATCYGILNLYRPELPKSGLAHWQPKRVLHELLQIDPHVTAPQTLSIRDPASGEWHVLGGTDHRFSAKWASEAHNALGAALHVPTVSQVASGKQHGLTEYLSRYEKYLPEIERTLNSQAWHLRLVGPNWKIKCRCGFEMQRRTERVSSGDIITCSDCGRNYDIAIDGDEITIEERRLVWACLQCNARNAMPEIELAENIKTKCRECEEPTQVRRTWAVFQKARPAT